MVIADIDEWHVPVARPVTRIPYTAITRVMEGEGLPAQAETEQLGMETLRNKRAEAVVDTADQLTHG